MPNVEKMSIALTPELAAAVRSAIDLWLYIAQDNPGAADRLLVEIEDKLLLLAANPQLGPARPDIALKKSCLLKELTGLEGEGQTNLSSPVVK